MALDDDQPMPDVEAAIEAVTPSDLARVATTYFSPQRCYVGRHQPVVTVASGAAAAGAMMGLGVAAWAGRKLWRRRKSYRMGY
jgi:hypothetical protein